MLNSVFECKMINELISLKRQYINAMCVSIPDDLADLREEVAEFVVYPDVTEWSVNWQEDNITFLQDIGLPASATTMIEFRAPAEIDLEHIYVGFNNYGDRIAVVKATGNVVYINHDFNDRIEYMNRDAVSLFRSICLFADMISGQTGFAEKIGAIDPEAIHEDNWWHRAHVAWVSTRD